MFMQMCIMKKKTLNLEFYSIWSKLFFKFHLFMNFLKLPYGFIMIVQLKQFWNCFIL